MSLTAITQHSCPHLFESIASLREEQRGLERAYTMVTICAVRNFVWEGLVTKSMRCFSYQIISGKYVGRQQGSS